MLEWDSTAKEAKPYTAEQINAYNETQSEGSECGYNADLFEVTADPEKIAAAQKEIGSPFCFVDSIFNGFAILGLFPSKSSRRLVCGVKVEGVYERQLCNFVNDCVQKVVRKHCKAGCHNVF